MSQSDPRETIRMTIICAMQNTKDLLLGASDLFCKGNELAANALLLEYKSASSNLAEILNKIASENSLPVLKLEDPMDQIDSKEIKKNLNRIEGLKLFQSANQKIIQSYLDLHFNTRIHQREKYIRRSFQFIGLLVIPFTLLLYYTVKYNKNKYPAIIYPVTSKLYFHQPDSKEFEDFNVIKIETDKIEVWSKLEYKFFGERTIQNIKLFPALHSQFRFAIRSITFKDIKGDIIKQIDLEKGIDTHFVKVQELSNLQMVKKSSGWELVSVGESPFISMSLTEPCKVKSVIMEVRLIDIWRNFID